MHAQRACRTARASATTSTSTWRSRGDARRRPDHAPLLNYLPLNPEGHALRSVHAGWCGHRLQAASSYALARRDLMTLAKLIIKPWG